MFFPFSPCRVIAGFEDKKPVSNYKGVEGDGMAGCIPVFVAGL